MFKKLKVQAVLGVVAGSLAIGAPSVSAETEIDLNNPNRSECLPWGDMGHWLFWDWTDPFESLSYTTTDSQFIVDFTSGEGKGVYFDSYVYPDLTACGSGTFLGRFVSCLNLTDLGSDPATDYFTGFPTTTSGGDGQLIRTDDARFIILLDGNANTYFQYTAGATTDRSFAGLLTITLLNDVSELDGLSNEFLCNWVGGDESKGCSGPYGNFCDYYEYLVQRVEESEGLPDTL